MELYGDFTIDTEPYEEEQDVYTTISPDEQVAEMLGEDPTSERVRLYSKIQNMSGSEKRIFIKILQQDTMMKLLSAMKNLKKTTAEEWKSIIKKMNQLKDVKVIDKSGFDFSAFLKTLIPLVGALAGTLLAMRESEAKESECAEALPENDPLTDPSFERDAEEQLYKSIVLQMCNLKENGFLL